LLIQLTQIALALIILVVALAALTEIGGTALKHPSYISDLAPCDFWAFPTLKGEMLG
jgi:hypothetical protein